MVDTSDTDNTCLSCNNTGIHAPTMNDPCGGACPDCTQDNTNTPDTLNTNKDYWRGYAQGTHEEMRSNSAQKMNERRPKYARRSKHAICPICKSKQGELVDA